MRRVGNRTLWLGRDFLGAMSLAAAVICPPLMLAADIADATKASSSEVVSQNLRKVLDGAAPMGVSDLRAMQGHVRKLSDQLKKCTVGVQVQAAWGSGVIITFLKPFHTPSSFALAALIDPTNGGTIAIASGAGILPANRGRESKRP